MGSTRAVEQQLTGFEQVAHSRPGRASTYPPAAHLEHLMARAFDGAALRDARRLAGIPAAQLAAAIGRTEWTVWSYETGRTRPSVDVAADLADVLDLRLDQLLRTTEKAAA